MQRITLLTGGTGQIGTALAVGKIRLCCTHCCSQVLPRPEENSYSLRARRSGTRSHFPSIFPDCVNYCRGEALAKIVRKQSQNDDVDVCLVDLSSTRSMRAFSSAFTEK
jgi:hypothetical protein